MNPIPEKEIKPEYKLELHGRYLARSGREYAWSINGKGLTWRNEESVFKFQKVFGGEVIKLTQ